MSVGTTLGEERHLPLWERSQVSREGVTCVTCHRIDEQFGKANDMWSPLEDGDSGVGWKTGSGQDLSPLVIGQGLPLGSNSVCKAITAAAKPVESKKRFYFF